MRKLHLLESKTYAQGNVQLSLQNVPAAKHINALHVAMDLLFTAGAAAAAISGSQLYRLFQNVQLGRLIDSTGLLLHYLEWMQAGHEAYLCAGIPATNAGTFRRRVYVEIPWMDRGAGSPGDTSPGSEDHAQQAINVNIPAFATLGAGTWDTLASIAGTVRAFGVLEDNQSRQVNPACRIGYVDATAQSINLPPGLYEYVFCYNEDGTGITNAEVTGVTVKADGEIICDQLTISEIIEEWNAQRAMMATVRADSATAPVAGSRITCEPAFTSGAATTVTCEFLPLLWKPPRGMLSGGIMVEQGLSFQFSGTKTSFRLAYKLLEPHDSAGLLNRFHKRGVPVSGLGQVAPVTANAAPLPASKAKLARYLPVRTK